MVFVHDWDAVAEGFVPALITCRASPSLYIPENSEWLRDHIKGSQLAAFNGGHIHFLQDPDHFNQVVMDFIG